MINTLAVECYTSKIVENQENINSYINKKIDELQNKMIAVHLEGRN